MKNILLLFLFAFAFQSQAQTLKIKPRPANALSGSAFSTSIRDTTISLDDREQIIFREIRSGNIPDFYRKLTEIRDTLISGGTIHTIRYYVIPDFIAIGSDEDYFYTPMRPQMAQKVANFLKCSLPSRKISDRIYRDAVVRMIPEPIPPSPQMVTIPVFETHNRMVRTQRNSCLAQFPLGSLVAGNKKDVVISNKIYNDKGVLRVVIYGWHKADGKAIQPLYNGHTPLHVDYSHGIRLVQSKVWVNGKKTSVRRVLASDELNGLLSDEGAIRMVYPVK